jgi:hypothetical protein
MTFPSDGEFFLCIYKKTYHQKGDRYLKKYILHILKPRLGRLLIYLQAVLLSLLPQISP